MQQLNFSGSSQRIDTWLSSQFPYSRNFFQHILQRGGITVIPQKAMSSGSTVGLSLRVKKSYKLQEGDIVCIDSLERYLDGGVLEECPAVHMQIMLEKEDYLVVYKEKGMLSHPNSVRDVSHPSVVGAMYHYFQEQGLPSMGSFIRAGLVHRLDKDTDGLMIIAKTEKGLQHFKGLFQRKSASESLEEKESVPLKKRYKARCCASEQGKDFLRSMEDALPYIIDEIVEAKVPHTLPKQGLTKILSYNYETAEEVSISCEILTGRTHQIRVHLSNHGLPIVGDYIYGKEEERPLQLSAVRLYFEDPDGIIQDVSSPSA